MMFVPSVTEPERIAVPPELWKVSVTCSHHRRSVAARSGSPTSRTAGPDGGAPDGTGTGDGDGDPEGPADARVGPGPGPGPVRAAGDDGRGSGTGVGVGVGGEPLLGVRGVASAAPEGGDPDSPSAGGIHRTPPVGGAVAPEGPGAAPVAT
ncbi:hypothetical protein [Streptomyces phaeoluteigriseus]